ncbi:Ferric reductase NAD binding domain containing protein [Amanita muscaria]
MPNEQYMSCALQSTEYTPQLRLQVLLAPATFCDTEQRKRNKSERRRLQGLQRCNSNLHATGSHLPALTWRHKFAVWTNNEGGRQMFFGVWILLHVLVLVFGFVNYQLKDNYDNARSTFGVTFAIARAAALMLHVDVIFILFPVCRNFISLLRQTPLNTIIPFDKNVTFHKAVAWSIVVGTVIHIAAHMVNFARLAMSDPSAVTPGQKVIAFLAANFTTGPGATGWFMTFLLTIIVFFSTGKKRRAHFERFWYSHHLFIFFFIAWQLHGMWCMIKPDRPPFCSWNQIGVFWVSYFQWHPFTLTSAPEEDYISVHIRVVGDFTRALAKAVGCDFDSKGRRGKGEKGEKNADVNGTRVVGGSDNPLNRTLPRMMVDGPFGSASEDFLNYETVLLVGSGIGVTPFASILKSIWYRMNNFGTDSKRTRLSKVYFTWVIRDFGSAEWFHSLLHAIEEQDTQNRIEINIYFTAKIKDDDVTNIIVQDVGADKDAITSLRAPTHFGRPNWDRVFSSIADKHPETDVGVFFCGLPALSKQLHTMCNKCSTFNGTRFFYGKGE